MKYKIVSSTNPVFLNVEMPFDFSDKTIGDSVNIFGQELKITQTGTVYLCVSEKAVMTLQEIPEEIEEIEEIQEEE